MILRSFETLLFYIVFQVLNVLIKICKLQPPNLLFLFVFISFYVNRYHFSKIFRTSFKNIWKRYFCIFVTNFPFLTDLFHQKSSFHSWDIQIFVFLSFPLFLPVSHCFRGWSKMYLRVYDAIDCLNKNSITHFAWYLKKEKRHDIQTLSIDGVSNKEHFYGKIMQKICSKS